MAGHGVCVEGGGGRACAILGRDSKSGTGIETPLNTLSPTQVPERWEKEAEDMPSVDYDALLRRIEAMDMSEFEHMDVDQLMKQYSA